MKVSREGNGERTVINKQEEEEWFVSRGEDNNEVGFWHVFEKPTGYPGGSVIRAEAECHSEENGEAKGPWTWLIHLPAMGFVPLNSGHVLRFSGL